MLNRSTNRSARRTNLDPSLALWTRAQLLGSGYGTGERLRLKAAVDALHQEWVSEAKALQGRIVNASVLRSAARSEPPA